MRAIIQTGGKQYMVTKGDRLTIEKIEKNVGDAIDFQVLALTGDTPRIGTPHVAGAKVVAKVLKQMRGEKLIVSTYKKRKGYHKNRGHRQSLTQIEITSVSA